MLSADCDQAHALGTSGSICAALLLLQVFPELAFLSEWIARGYAGEMDYMEKSADVRADIRNFLPSARSVIVMGTVYNTEQGSGIGDRGSGSGDQGSGGREQGIPPARDAIKVARYARGQDYHKVIEDRLRELVAVDARSAFGSVRGRALRR